MTEETISSLVANAAFGEPVPIAENLHLVRVPLPNNPLKSLNSYIIASRDTTAIIDVGFNHPACQRALDDALAALGRTWDSVEIVLTHSHADHTGNLDRIHRRNMRVFANFHSFQEVSDFLDAEAHVFEPLLARVASPNGTRQGMSPELLPVQGRPSVTRLQEGDVYRCGNFAFEIVQTPGHDPWHICLYEKSRKLMIIGDHVLKRISPSITSWTPEHDALADYLANLDKIRNFDVDLVLPAHGVPFSDMRSRVDELIAHHKERLDEICDLVASGHRDVVDIASNASWKYPDWHAWPLEQKFFSMGETLAHLFYLAHKGNLQQTQCGGEYRYRIANTASQKKHSERR